MRSIACRPAATVLLLSLGPGSVAAAQTWALPDLTYTPEQVNTIISPVMSEHDVNQPAAVSGLLMLAGDGHHQLWDVRDPYAPVQVSTFDSPHGDGESESHQLAFAKTADGRVRAVTISGRGVDLWDLTDPTAPTLLSTVLLEGIDYGDNTHAVWGVAWVGDRVYAGGTNTGVHVVDVSDPTEPVVVNRVPTSAFGGVSAGPLWVFGSTLVVTTPKDHAGVATLDLSLPDEPAPLDVVAPSEDSYIGGFYGGHAVLITPLRVYDVTTDPSAIELVSTVEVPESEYVSFGDGTMWLGGLRPEPGAWRVDMTDPAAPAVGEQIRGRWDDGPVSFFTDDQFSVPLGNLLVLGDDEASQGAILVPTQAARDAVPPEVLAVAPRDGATAVSPQARVSVSLSDQIALESVDAEALVVRPLDGGEPVTGDWGLAHTVLTFSPHEPLQPDTTYEVELVAGGLTDLVGNPVASTTRWVFSTGDDLTDLSCAVSSLPPVAVGEAATLSAEGTPATASWELGDGRTVDGATASATWDAPGRYSVTLTVTEGQASRRCAAVQIVHPPLAEQAPTRSSTVVVDDGRRRAYVVVPDADRVTAIDLDTRQVVFEAPVGDHPQTLAQDAEGVLWVAERDADALTLLDPDDGTLVDTIPLRHGAAPYGVAVDPSGTTAWVSLQGAGRVEAFDVATRRRIGAVPLTDPLRGPHVEPRGLAVSPDGQRVYVGRWISGPDAGEVHEIDAGRMAVADVWTLAHDPGPDSHDAGRGVPNVLGQLALSPDGRRLAVPSKKDNTRRGLLRDGEPLDADNTVRTIVSWLDVTGPGEDLGARIDLDDHDSASAVAFSPLGDLAFVTSQGSAQVDVYDVAAGRLVAGFSTGLAPQGLALSENGELVVADRYGRTLTLYDVAGLLQGTDATGDPLGAVSVVSEEPMAPEVLLGARLFHDARSSQMSQDGYLSCATCHPEGGHDGRTWDFASRGEGLRNTIDLRGRAGTAHGPLHWSGNFDEVQDFEHDIRSHQGGSGLMADGDFFADGRDVSLGTPKAGVSERLDALAAYVATLAAVPRSPYRAPDGTLTAAGRRGARVFARLGCDTCHSGPAFTDSAEGVRHDVGTLSATSGQRLGDTLDGLDTPTLLGVWATAPYLHDGSAPTLSAVLDNPEHTGTASLSTRDRADLVAYLRQLEGADDEAPGGVGCATLGRPGAGGSGTAGWLGLLVLLGASRRRCGGTEPAGDRDGGAPCGSGSTRR